MFAVYLRIAVVIAASAFLVYILRPVWASLHDLALDHAAPESPIPGWIATVSEWIVVLIALSMLMVAVGAAIVRRRAAGGPI